MRASFKLDALTAAAKRLGIADISELNPGLASVLVGAPLVAATNVSVAEYHRKAAATAPEEPDPEQ